MKKIIFNKILSDVLKFLIVSLTSASIIIWVFQAVNYLDIIVEDGRDYIVYFQYSLLVLPKIVSKIFPFILFFSFYYVLNKYEKNNELIIFWNFGVNKISLVNFFLVFSLVLLLIQLIFTTLIVPKTQDLARNIIRSSNVSVFENFIKAKKFNDLIKGLTIHTEQKDKNGKLKNIYIKKNDGEKVEITYAKNGEFKNINNTQFLVLYDGESINDNGQNLTNFSFTESTINLSKLETNVMKTIKTQENSTKDLYSCYLSLKKLSSELNQNFNVQNCTIDNLHIILREFYKRLVIPFYIPVLILISLLVILKSKEEMKYQKNKIIVFFLGLSTIITSETSLSYIEGSIYKNIYLIILPIIILISLYLYFLNKFVLIKKNK